VNEKTAAMEEIQARTGWTDDTLFLFALRMLLANGLTHEFEEVLQTSADEEDQECQPADDEPAGEVVPDWKHYIDHQGTTCPYCGGKDLEGGSFNADGGYAWQSITCSGCGCEWDDVYRLVEVEIEHEEDQHGQEEAG
jgi:hypothetical protein